MLWLKKIKSDDYLKKFVNFCKERYGNNLVAIIIYGSYTWGYFDKEKSDYDVFVIFKDKTPRERKEINKKFQKFSCNIFAQLKIY